MFQVHPGAMTARPGRLRAAAARGSCSFWVASTPPKSRRRLPKPCFLCVTQKPCHEAGHLGSFINTSSLGAQLVKCLSCRLPHLPPTFLLRVRWPLRPHAPLPHRAIRRPISPGPPVRPAMQPGSFLGLLGPRGSVVGLFVRAHEPDTHFGHPPLVA